MWTHKYKDVHKLNNGHIHRIQSIWNLNMILYGPSGSGKKTVIERLIKNQINGNFNAAYIFKTFDIVTMDVHKKLEQSIYFRQNKNVYEFVLQESNFDRFVIRDVIKSYANTFYICDLIPIYKIIILYNVDCLSIEALVMLNTVISQSIKTCRFILITSKISKIPNKLKHNCLQYKIIRPTSDELTNILKSICVSENLIITEEHIVNICVDHENQICDCITQLQLDSLGIKSSLSKVMNGLYTKVIQNDKLINIREVLYILLINNVPSRFIIKQLGELLLKDSSLESKYCDITHVLCVYDHRMIFEERSIYHLEACMYRLLISIHEPIPPTCNYIRI